MTNYLPALTVGAALSAAACSAAENPAPAAKLTAAPAGTSTTVPAAAGVPHYVQAPAGSTLTFSFIQAGAENQGVFKQFATELNYDEKNLAAGSLKVAVQTGSFDTQDKDRNDTLAGADLLDPKKYPTAQFVATSLTRGAKGIEAAGKLTLHGVTKDLKLPLDIRTTATGAEISGETTIKRLDYGVGTGDWKSTEWVGDEVKLQYKVALTRTAK
ncbi:MAG TPA: YceI family protein [Steroidobacteraceae bacterium]|nr:YceI family protein [Steroidobacteraceae bacterium]